MNKRDVSEANSQSELAEWVLTRLNAVERETLRQLATAWMEACDGAPACESGRTPDETALGQLASALNHVARLALNAGETEVGADAHALCMRVAFYCSAAASKVRREQLFAEPSSSAPSSS